MTQQQITAPGWFPDGEGQQRYWDGDGWTDHTAPRGRHVDDTRTEPPAPPANGRRRGWVLAVTAVVALMTGLVIGVAAGGTDPETTPEYKAIADSLATSQGEVASLEANISDLEATLSDLEAQLEDAEAEVGDLPRREAELKDGQATLAKAQARLTQDRQALREDARDVAAREREVGAVERTIENNTVSGEGLYEVGRDMKPGTYKTAGNSGCYYAILNSSDTFDIADNNNINGPAVVTVSTGQFFETQRCADWVLTQ